MLGYESQVVNGQLINVAPAQGFDPLTFGSMYTGPGFWPRNGVYNVPPVVPSPSTGTLGGSASGMGGEGGGDTMGGHPLPSAGSVTASGTMNYLHPTKSPFWWAIGFLAIGLWMLHYIHYK